MSEPKASEIDVTLVAARRPELLARTLDSFASRLFSNFSINRFVANIDPVFGDVGAQRDCRDIILARFPHAEVFEPAVAGFGAAVRRVWSASCAPVLFHVEDDWILNEPLHPEDVLPLLSGQTVAVAPISKEIGWNGRDLYNVRTRRTRLFGLTIRRRTVNIHGTSPRFMTGDFARRCAELMDPELDPEKQMRPPHNPTLRAYIERSRCRLLPARGGGPLIVDIGRDWRVTRGIEKVLQDGRSVWSGHERS